MYNVEELKHVLPEDLFWLCFEFVPSSRVNKADVVQDYISTKDNGVAIDSRVLIKKTKIMEVWYYHRLDLLNCQMLRQIVATAINQTVGSEYRCLTLRDRLSVYRDFMDHHYEQTSSHGFPDIQ